MGYVRSCFFVLVLVSVANISPADGKCIFEKDKCQCAEMIPDGSACLSLESGSGNSGECKAAACADGMKCDCSGFEVCSINSCPSYVARAGAEIVIGKTVDCAESPKGPSTCVKAIKSSWEATLKTTEAATNATEKAKDYVLEAKTTMEYLGATATIMAKYAKEGKDIVTSGSFSGKKYSKIKDDYIAIDEEFKASMEDKNHGEAAVKIITALSTASSNSLKDAEKSDVEQASFRKNIALLEEERKGISADDSYGIWNMNDRIHRLRDMLESEKRMAVEYKHHSCDQARLARATMIGMRTLLASSVERQAHGAGKLKDMKEVNARR